MVKILVTIHLSNAACASEVSCLDPPHAYQRPVPQTTQWRATVPVYIPPTQHNTTKHHQVSRSPENYYCITLQTYTAMTLCKTMKYNKSIISEDTTNCDTHCIANYYHTVHCDTHYIANYHQTVHCNRHCIANYHHTVLCDRHCIANNHHTVHLHIYSFYQNNKPWNKFQWHLRGWQMTIPQCSRTKSCGLWWCTTGRITADFSTDHSAFIMKGQD